MQKRRKAKLAALVTAMAVNSVVAAERDDVVHGDLVVEGAVHVQDVALRGGAVLEVPGELQFKRGGVTDPLPPVNGHVRAQPGGNFEIQPLLDYARAALDIYPTAGKQPDTDALAELTIHRIHPTNAGHEMLSVSALARAQQRFGVIVEAHGGGRVRPLDFQMIQGGLLAVDDNIEPFSAIAMRMRTDGTMQFGASRDGGSTGPVDAIVVERDRVRPGESASDYIRLTGKRSGPSTGNSDWRMNVQIGDRDESAFTIENREDGGDYRQMARVLSNGDVEVNQPGAGVVLTSPNGAKWRLSVSDDGEMQTSAAN